MFFIRLKFGETRDIQNASQGSAYFTETHTHTQSHRTRSTGMSATMLMTVLLCHFYKVGWKIYPLSTPHTFTAMISSLHTHRDIWPQSTFPLSTIVLFEYEIVENGKRSIETHSQMHDICTQSHTKPSTAHSIRHMHWKCADSIPSGWCWCFDKSVVEWTLNVYPVHCFVGQATFLFHFVLALTQFDAYETGKTFIRVQFNVCVDRGIWTYVICTLWMHIGIYYICWLIYIDLPAYGRIQWGGFFFCYLKAEDNVGLSNVPV